MDPDKLFPISGMWWMAEHPDQSAHGVLTRDEKGMFQLKLGGKPLPFPRLKIWDLLGGNTVFGWNDSQTRAISLLGAWEISSPDIRKIAPNQPQVIGSHAALVGKSHPRSPATFEGCSFSLQGLSEWARSHFRLIHPESSNDSYGFRFRDVDPIEFDTAVAHWKLWASVEEHQDELSLEVKQKTAWTIDMETPLSFEGLLKQIIQPLEYFQILLTSEPTEAFDVYLRPTHAGPSTGDSLQLLADWLPTADRQSLRPFDWPFSFESIVDQLGDLTTSWISTLREAEPAVVLLFSVIDQRKDFYLENRLFTLASAAEAYHRHRNRFRQQVVSDDDHCSRVTTVFEGCPPEHRPWVEQRLKHSNEPTFRNRIRDMRAYVGPFGAELLDSRALNTIAGYRNQLAHGLSLPGTAEEGSTSVYVASEKLNLLLRAAFLREIGFEESAVRSALRRSGHNRSVADYKF